MGTGKEKQKTKEKTTVFREGWNRKDLKTLLILTGIYVLGISTLLRAHVLYKDDLERVVREGYLGWEMCSRYISNYLAILIQGGVSLTDQSPLQQLIAALFMAASSLIVVRALESVHEPSDRRGRWVKYPAAAIMGLNPYFLACFSFQFDSAFMAFSVLAAVFPFALSPRRRKTFLAASLVCTLVVMMTYQASSGIFPMLVLFYALLQWTDRRTEGKQALVLIGQSAAAYLAGLAIFKLFFMHNLPSYKRGAMIPFAHLLSGLEKNYRILLRVLRHDFPLFWKILFLLAGMLFFVSVLWTSHRNRLATLIVLVAAVAACCLLSTGVLIMLEDFPTTRRSAYGIFVLLSFMLITLACRSRIHVGKLVCLSVFWIFFSFSFTYGNALEENSRWVGVQLETAVRDLNSLALMQTDTKKQIQLAGRFAVDESLKKARKTYPVLKATLPSLKAEYQWNWYRLMHYYGLKNVYRDKNNDLCEARLPLLLETMFYEIYGDDQHILIEFRQ